MNQRKKDTTSAIVDGLLRFIATGGFITTALVAPNAIQVFDKPLADALKKLDERSRERELRRITYYMKRKGLITYSSKDYEHGIQLTNEGKKRLQQRSFSSLAIPKPEKWDKRWRLVFFDIPVEGNKKRRSLTTKLRYIGFQQLQKSIWIHPFPCRSEIEVIAEVIGVRKFITYIEITEIDNEKQLLLRFNKLIKNA